MPSTISFILLYFHSFEKYFNSINFRWSRGLIKINLRPLLLVRLRFFFCSGAAIASVVSDIALLSGSIGPVIVSISLTVVSSIYIPFLSSYFLVDREVGNRLISGDYTTFLSSLSISNIYIKIYISLVFGVKEKV